VRADQLLVERGLAPSRSAAQRLIKAGAVQAQWLGKPLALDKAGVDLPEDCSLLVTNDDELRYVSRGGLKLEGALRHLGWNPQGWACLDVGSSTGGFADCLLQQGAGWVLGLDVGHGQLHPKLQNHPHMANLEGVNVRHLKRTDLPTDDQAKAWDLMVVDVSFISLSLILPALHALMTTKTRLLALVKPQFELGPQALNKQGLVTLPKVHYPQLQSRMLALIQQHGLYLADYFDSPITGQDGNREFFMAATLAEAQ
jgi:23S rRNA (cytidine1920-2'-O)/16S rRNA (cytidine1409-2'-O)-methyltransferase